jgi:hypothetical protein
MFHLWIVALDKIEKIKSFLSLSSADRIISRNSERIKMNKHKSTRRKKTEDGIQKSEISFHDEKWQNLSFILCLLFSVLCMFSGCAEQQKTVIEQIPVAGIEKSRMMETVENVLARMYFVIDKKDVNAGYIKTRPLEGAQFFEFWRSDNVGAENWLYGNIDSIRRTVEITIDRQIHCKVQVQRLSLPEQEVTSSARAYRMFSRSTPVMQTLQLNPAQYKQMAWIDLGRDVRLENEILKRISSKLDSEQRAASSERRATR